MFMGRKYWVMLVCAGGMIVGLVLSAGGFSPGVAQGDDFRIETTVFFGAIQRPSSSNVTLFHGGVVYDFMSDPEKVAVFDVGQERFILLDPARKIKTVIPTKQLTAYADRIRSWAGRQEGEFFQFVAQPNFEQRFDESTGDLMMASPHMTYHIKTTAASSDSVMQQYQAFSDWYARLNSATNVGALPPFARLAVNKALADKRRIPRQVEVTINPPKSTGRKPITIRSEHRVQGRLVESDKKRIDQVANQLHCFKEVALAEFVAAAEEDRRQAAAK
jgi:hypothetical protein